MSVGEHVHEEQGLEIGHQFEDLEQQVESYTVGMWIFLVTEVLFFGGLFTAYIIYRSKYFVDFAYAHQELSVPLGGLNTAILLTSSFTMALAVRSAMLDRWKPQIAYLGLTLLFALGFLVVKYFEYGHKFQHHLVPGPDFHFPVPQAQHAEIFFVLYFAMTGLHGLHVLVGAIAISALMIRTYLMRNKRQDFVPVEMTGLYWHFVDIVWIFLYPLFYLIGPLHGG